MQKGMSLFLQEQTCTNNGGPRWESVICLFEQRLRASMIADYDIVFGTPDDVPGILTLQEANLPHKGGTLSVRLSADWFQRAILEKSLIVCRREGAVVGYHPSHVVRFPAST